MSGNKSGGGGFQPFAAPNIVPSTPQQHGQAAPAAPPAQGSFGGVFVPAAPSQPAPSNTVAGTLPFTRVNSTNDPRVLWEDGQIAIIFAGDFPANTGMGRSKSRKTIQDAITAQIDPTLTTSTGAGSRSDLIKVYLAELLQRPVGTPGGSNLQSPVGRLPNSPSVLSPSPPRIASSGTYKGQVIPDFPHVCNACGGKMYQGMFEGIHNTPDGRCPKGAETKPRRR